MRLRKQRASTAHKLRLPRAPLSSGHPREPRAARKRARTHRHLARNSSLKHRRKLENRVLLARVSSGLPRHQLLCPGASRGVTTNRARPAARNCRSRRRRRRWRRPRRGTGSLARRMSAGAAHRAWAALLGGAAPNDALQARIVRHGAGSAGFGPLSRVPPGHATTRTRLKAAAPLAHFLPRQLLAPSSARPSSACHGGRVAR